eukprot:575603-Pleurochrysis_carterae.AAC.1
MVLTEEHRRRFAKVLYRKYVLQCIDRAEFRQQQQAIKIQLTEDDRENLEDEVNVMGALAFMKKHLEPLPYEPVDAAIELGGKYSQTLRFSPAAAHSWAQRRVNQGIALVPYQTAIPQVLADGRFLQSAANAGLLDRARDDLMHDAVIMGKVQAPNHPNRELHNAIIERGGDVYATYVTRPVSSGTVLGLLGGFLSVGSEYEAEQTALQTDDINALIGGFDLEGCLAEKGGWINVDEHNSLSYVSAQHEACLVLDSFKAMNELSVVADVRDHPLQDAVVDVHEYLRLTSKECVYPAGARQASAAFVELNVKGAPRIAIVAICDLDEHSEVICDWRKNHWMQAARLWEKARSENELRKTVNELLNKIENVESDATPQIFEAREFKRREVEARAAAVEACDAWERAQGG